MTIATKLAILMSFAALSSFAKAEQSCAEQLQNFRLHKLDAMEPYPIKTLLDNFAKEHQRLEKISEQKLRKAHRKSIDRELAGRGNVLARVQDTAKANGWEKLETWKEVADLALKFHYQFIDQLNADLEKRGFASIEEAAMRTPAARNEKPATNRLELARNVFRRIYGTPYLDTTDYRYTGLLGWKQMVHFFIDLKTFERSATEPTSQTILGKINSYCFEFFTLPEVVD